jgi:hypothetical protein
MPFAKQPLQRRKLCVLKRQPLAAGVFEVHLYASIRAAAFDTGDATLAELLVEHALADAP